MNANFEPSPDFVARVMRQVRTYEESRASLVLDWLRYLAASGALLGVLRAAPVF
ncbi:hypothetical protein [Fundidesulfovibrio terrae]|uniref:hypothetical protein n=1 Tax=Fundidesulfovibrio terrae TaxID=2922866 RepID=UPI001FAF2681|nr:hypothetical protein [Fundidesulfovibrio terrae]